MAEQNIFVIKANGEREAFDIEKLAFSLRKSHASNQSVEKVTSHILQELEDGMETKEIYRHAFEVLHRIEKGVALRYSLRRALLELGPSGFPFEKFIAEVFKSQGYETLTDQIANGMCVSHEIDVVAWNKEKLLMSEVKFHNQLGLKSDLKVVLYVKARFDDLHKASFNYGNEQRTLTDGLLITNTKFTTTAVKYAECQNMKIIGWNYPLDGNLQDMIEQANLHPLTSLHTLSERDKKQLLEKGIVLCKTIEQQPTYLENLGLTAANIDAVLEEIKEIYTPRQK